MYALVGLLILLVGLIIVLMYLGKRRQEYQELVKGYGEGFQLGFMAPASLYIMDKLKLYQRFPKGVQRIHEKIIKVYGSRDGLQKTQLFIAQDISVILVITTIFTFFAIVSEGDYSVFIFGLIVAILVALVMIKDLDSQIQRKEHAILIELPEYLNKVIMLVDAGETVIGSIIKSAQSKIEGDGIENPLYKELKLSINELKMNQSFEEVMEDFSRRCAIPEVSLFTTTLLLNYRKGGSDFTSSLRELSRELWEKRKAIAKIQGEQASSKMVFPMVLVFLIILVIIATPALMLM